MTAPIRPHRTRTLDELAQEYGSEAPPSAPSPRASNAGPRSLDELAAAYAPDTAPTAGDVDLRTRPAGPPPHPPASTPTPDTRAATKRLAELTARARAKLPSDATGVHPDPNFRPGLLQRTVEMTGATAAEMVRHPLNTAASLVTEPVRSAIHAVVSPSVGELPHDARLSKGGNPGGQQTDAMRHTPYDAEHGAVTEQERAVAGLQTLANLSLPMVHKGASSLLERTGIDATTKRVGAAAAAGVLPGAAYTPNDPLAGGLTGGVIGGLLAGAGEPAVRHGTAAGERVVRRTVDVARKGAAKASAGMERLNALAERFTSDGSASEQAVREQLARSEERRQVAEREANTDHRTQLGNTRAFEKALPSAENDPAQAVVRFDLNNFKSVNDVAGHERGDAVLVDVSRVLRQAAHDVEVPARLFRPGGDEFAAIVPKAKAAAFRDRVEALYGVQEHAPGVRSSISGGVGETNAAADAEAYARKALHKQAQGIAPAPGRGGAALVDEASLPAGAARIRRVDVADLDANPAKFQYKANTEAGSGAGAELKGLTKFDESLAGILSAWRDPETGRLTVVNGHHRLELAKRTGHPSLWVQEISAPNATAARAMGAVQNIAEGRGTAIDAAKFFRDTGLSADDLRERVSFKGSIARDGMALSKLAPDVFDRVAREDVPRPVGVAVGDLLGDSPEMQRAAVSAIEKSGKRLTENEAREVARQVLAAGTETVRQDSLFGVEESRHALFVERAQLAEAIKKRLGADKRLFGFVSKEGRAEDLARAGNAIDVEASSRLAGEAAQLEQVFSTLYTRSGPIADALTEAARRVAAGEKVAAVAAELYPTVREAIRQTLEEGQGGNPPPPASRQQGQQDGSSDLGEEGHALDSTDPNQPDVFGSPDWRRMVRRLRGEAAPNPDVSTGAYIEGGFKAWGRLHSGEASPVASEDLLGAMREAARHLAERITEQQREAGRKVWDAPFTRDVAEAVMMEDPARLAEFYEQQPVPKGRDPLEHALDVASGHLARLETALRGTRLDERGAASRYESPVLRRVDALYAQVEHTLREDVLGVDEQGKVAPEVYGSPLFRRRQPARVMEDVRPAGPVPREAMGPLEHGADRYGFETLRQLATDTLRPDSVHDLETTAEAVAKDMHGWLRRHHEAGHHRGTHAPTPDAVAYWIAGDVEGLVDYYARQLGGDGDAIADAILNDRNAWFYREEARHDTGGHAINEVGTAALGRALAFYGGDHFDAGAINPKLRDAVDAAEREMGLRGPRPKSADMQRLARDLGDVYSSPAKRGDTVRRATGDADLFGDHVTEDVAAQTSAFGDDAGTAASRSLAEADRASRAELEQLRQRFALEGDEGKRRTLAAEIARVQRFVDRDRAISPDEMGARALAEHGPDPDVAGPDQGVLFSPAAQPNRLGLRVRAALGITNAKLTEVTALRTISTRLAEALDVPLREGRGNLKRRHALGAFWLKSESIRVRKLNDVATVVHESGHFFDQKFGLRQIVKRVQDKATRTAIGKELVAMGRALYGNRRPAGGYASEGVAEWFSYYVTDPAVLDRQAPHASTFIRGVLVENPALKAAFDQAQDDYRRFVAAPDEAKLQSMIAAEPASRFRLSGEQLVTWFFDDLEPVRRAVEDLGGAASADLDPYKLARLSKGNAGRVHDMLVRGVMDVKGRQRLTRGLGQILAQVPRGELPAFTRYLVAERVLEKHGQGIDTGFDVPAAQSVAKAGQARYGKAAAEVWGFSDALLRYTRDAGLLTEDGYQAIIAKNQKRVPFYRVFDPGDEGTHNTRSRALAKNSSGVMAMQGSTRAIYDPLQALVRDVYDVVDRAEKHRAAVELVKLAQSRQGGARVAEVLTEVPQTMNKIALARVLDTLQEWGLELPKDPAALAALQDQMLVAFYEKSTGGLKEARDLVMPLLIDGERKWVQIHDQAVWKALQGMGAVEMGLWEHFLGAPTRLLRVGATQLNPDFAPINPLRDSFQASIYSQGGTRPPLWLIGRGLYHLARHRLGLSDAMVTEWLQSGGESSNMLGADLARLHTEHQRVLQELVQREDPLVRRLALAPFRVARHPLDAMRHAFGIFENATRVGEFASSRERQMRGGASPAEARAQAALDARDVTIDFFRSGSVARPVNSVIAFLNAHLQDVDKMAREFNPANLSTAEGRKRYATVTARAVTFITVPSVALYLLQRHDPDYQEVPAWLKATSWVIVRKDGAGVPYTLPSGRKTRLWIIPRPHLLGFAFGAVPEQLLARLDGTDPRALEDLATQASRTLLPPWLPTAVAPLYENATNRKQFSGGPVVPRSVQGLAPSEQSTPHTGEVARVVGKATHTSPAKLENLVRGYTGGAGMLALDAADAVTRRVQAGAGAAPMRPDDPGRLDPLGNVPVLRRFVTDRPGANGKSVERLFSDFDEAEEKRLTWRRLLTEGRDARSYLDANRAEILGVVTSEETGGEAGPLRQYHDALLELLHARSAILGDDSMRAAERQVRARRIDDRILDLARRYQARATVLSRTRGHAASH